MARRVIIFILFVGALVALYVASRQYPLLETFVEKEADLRAALDRHPWTGFGIGFAIYLVVSLVPGTTGKALVAGWFFGFWAGLLMVNVGLTLAALMSFGISRYLCHDFVAARCGARLARFNAALEREGANYLFAARVLHSPFWVTNYVMGATRIRLRSFWWATQLGILPGNFVFVYAGSQVPTLQQLDEQGLAPLLSPGLLVAFVAASVGPLLVPAVVRRVRARLAGAR
ncbi:MAG: TVP38/TMEM64 family protein [Planctomycetes bacterium]|nr:TVP38/TMEM64 family protein [Planctomycetota bacterium]